MKPLEAGIRQHRVHVHFRRHLQNYGDGIANLGHLHACGAGWPPPPADGLGNAAYSAARWFRHTRTPTAAPAWCVALGGLMVKSTTTVGIDLEAQTYFAIDVKSGADDYYEYLASTGMGSTVVTYTNVNHQPHRAAPPGPRRGGAPRVPHSEQSSGLFTHQLSRPSGRTGERLRSPALGLSCEHRTV